MLVHDVVCCMTHPRNQILQSTRREEARRVLQDVEDRHAHIVELSKSILEIQQLFQDMSTMIEEQDSLVASVSSNINEVEANTTQATAQLSQAVKSARSARKKKWCLITFFMVVLVGVALWLLFQYYLIPQVFNKQPAPQPK